MVLVIIILSILCCTLCFTTWNLLRKNEKLDEEVLDYIDFTTQLKLDLRKAFEEMKRIDSKGGFQAEDEVGEVFKALKSVIDDLERKYDN